MKHKSYIIKIKNIRFEIWKKLGFEELKAEGLKGKSRALEKILKNKKLRTAIVIPAKAGIQSGNSDYFSRNFWKINLSKQKTPNQSEFLFLYLFSKNT